VVTAYDEGDRAGAGDRGNLILDDVARDDWREGGHGDVAAVGGAQGLEDVDLVRWVEGLHQRAYAPHLVGGEARARPVRGGRVPGHPEHDCIEPRVGRPRFDVDLWQSKEGRQTLAYVRQGGELGHPISLKGRAARPQPLAREG
jgi:hypothetical protein